MRIEADLPEDLVEFVRQMTELLEYASVDDFLASMIRRQQEALAMAGPRRDAVGEVWTQTVHDRLRQRILDAKRQSTPLTV